MVLSATVSTYTIAADVSDASSRGTSMGLIRGGVLFGAPTGLVVGGIVSEVAGTVMAFLLATVFAFLASGIGYKTIPETHVEGGTRTSVNPWEVDTSIPALTVGMTNFAILLVYFGVLFSTLVLFLAEQEIGALGFDAQGTSGLFMALTVVTAGLFMFFGGYLSDQRQSRIPLLIWFLVITAAGFILLAIADSIATLGIACLCIGAGQGGTSGPLMALLGDLTPNERMGRAVGTNNLLGDLGAGIGPMVALPLVTTIGFQPVFLASAALPTLAAVVLVSGMYWETGEILPAARLPEH